MPTVLFTAPYMIPFVDRFKPVFDQYGIELIIPDVQERMEEADLLKYAGQFDGTICGDDRYSLRVIEACAPRLKIISKWGTGHRFHRRRSLLPLFNQNWTHPERVHHRGSGFGPRLHARLRPPSAVDG